MSIAVPFNQCLIESIYHIIFIKYIFIIFFFTGDRHLKYFYPLIFTKRRGSLSVLLTRLITYSNLFVLPHFAWMAWTYWWWEMPFSNVFWSVIISLTLYGNSQLILITTFILPQTQLVFPTLVSPSTKFFILSKAAYAALETKT